MAEMLEKEETGTEGEFCGLSSWQGYLPRRGGLGKEWFFWS